MLKFYNMNILFPDGFLNEFPDSRFLSQNSLEFDSRLLYGICIKITI